MQPRQLTCYEYTRVPYDRVIEILRADASGLFQRATAAAATRAEEVVATLHVSVGGLEVGADVKIEVRSITENVSALGERATSVALAWKAARNVGLFPSMEAILSVYPLSRTETQLDLLGHYLPPFGAIGSAIDALVGHRVAQASVLRFVQDVAASLEAELRPSTGVGA